MSFPGRTYAIAQDAIDAAERTRNMLACADHLDDLIDAGYSPIMTEMQIKRGSAVIVVNRPMNHSPTGSQGSLCESGVSCFVGLRAGRS